MSLVDLQLGLNCQAWAVAHLLNSIEPLIENPIIIISTSPWYNDRERGLVFTVTDFSAGICQHIAVYEHRNSDCICALKWIERSEMNPPTLRSSGKLAYHGGNKWDTAKSVQYGCVGEMSKWVSGAMNKFIEDRVAKTEALATVTVEAG